MTNLPLFNMLGEVWKDIPGFIGHYQISSLGRVKSLRRERPNGGWVNECIMKLRLSKSGYYHVNLFKNGLRKTYKVHRLVAHNFIPNLERKPEVNRINGIKTINRTSNLEWCSRLENEIHKNKVLKITNKGTRHGKAKLSASDVIFIRNSKLAQKDLAYSFNVSQATISLIKNNINWRHI